MIKYGANKGGYMLLSEVKHLSCSGTIEGYYFSSYSRCSGHITRKSARSSSQASTWYIRSCSESSGGIKCASRSDTISRSF